MALEIKHVADLMGKNFRIPSFQRGYRWERKQIEQLLDDLADFAESIEEAEIQDNDNNTWNNENPHRDSKPTNNKLNIGYYCLQPLAVTNQGDFYDLIDGQQRLTTIYLILCYLCSLPSTTKLPYNLNQDIINALYSLKYESRDGAFFKNKLFMQNALKALDNIDFYFMTQGYKVIVEWFKSHTINPQTILELILPKSYNPNNNLRNARLHDVRFIWYETPVSTSIKTFNNLNYGKIGLTASELAKALLFECDRYEYAKRDIERGVAFARSTRWSAMEESLQDSFFWGMLSPQEEEKDLHLELILSFVASDIDQKYKYSEREGWKNTDDDWVFNIFSESVADLALCDEKGNKLPYVTQRVEYLWNCIQKVYTVFRNWFDDRKLYHHIGVYIFIATHYSGKQHKDVIKELYDLYLSCLKTDFETELSKKIGNLVRINSNAKIKYNQKDESGNDVECERVKKLDELRYGEDDKDIRKILLLFNVEMTLKNAQDEPRFPFHLASASGFDLKSLEHIHPQNLDNDDISYKDFKDWFDNKTNILQSNGVLSNQCNLTLIEAVKNLKQNLVDEKTFLANKTACLASFEEIDKKFDELADMDPKVMHTLYNLALVDNPTNAALSNNLLDAKRKILIERTKDGETYVPLGTWYAFNKHFSETVNDLKFWARSDREAYFSEIEKVYNEYTK